MDKLTVALHMAGGALAFILLAEITHRLSHAPFACDDSCPKLVRS